jgi:tetratricopeptide (TPR) repeat protein
VKRKLFFTLWLLAPVVGVALHYGPGQKGVALDNMATAIREAEAAKAAEKWDAAEQAYGRAIALATGNASLWAQLHVAKADARFMDGEVPEAIAELKEALAAAKADESPISAQNALLAKMSEGHYYAAWLVRLENVSEDEWRNQIDQARQGFRYLSETCASDAETEGGCGSETHQKNLESAIRLAQMDTSDLKALPLPKQ